MSPPILLWDVLPYITTFVVGAWWRFRYDQFGWTTRSSQLYERSLLRIASPLFHLGILAVVGGHVVGLLIPEAWTEWSGSARALPRDRGRARASPGCDARRGRAAHLPPPHHRPGLHGDHQERQDDVRLPGGAICLGLLTTMVGAGIIGDGHNYREDVSVWFRSILLLQPQGELMADAPPSFRVHAVAGMLLFMIWPFTRLVHAFSAPVGYLFRPYVVYRDHGPHDRAGHAPRRGWEKVGS